MSAWKNVRVLAECGCPRAFASMGDAYRAGICPRCHGRGEVEVPASEWAEALATVQGVERVAVTRTRVALTPKQRRERGVCGCEMTWGLVERCSTCGERNPGAPASASTREDEQANG